MKEAKSSNYQTDEREFLADFLDTSVQPDPEPELDDILICNFENEMEMNIGVDEMASL